MFKRLKTFNTSSLKVKKNRFVNKKKYLSKLKINNNLLLNYYAMHLYGQNNFVLYKKNFNDEITLAE